MVVISCLFAAMDGLSSVRIFLPKDIKTLESRNQMHKTIKEVIKRFPEADGLPMMDPIKDMEITDESFKRLVKRMELAEKKLFSNKFYNSPDEQETYELYLTKVKLNEKIRSVKKDITQAESILQLDDLKCHRRVLRRLGYISDSDVIEVKGRVACEISAGDELLLTELIFNGLFTEMTVEQIVALLSCFCQPERVKEEIRVREELAGPYKAMLDTARRIAKVSQESKLPIEEEEYVEQFGPQMIDVVYAWVQGAKFSQICKLTDIFEGSIIRSMRRIEELLRQLATAAKSIGNTELELKFTEGITKIKRDIIFAASLYL